MNEWNVGVLPEVDQPVMIQHEDVWTGKPIEHLVACLKTYVFAHAWFTYPGNKLIHENRNIKVLCWRQLTEDETKQLNLA